MRNRYILPTLLGILIFIITAVVLSHHLPVGKNLSFDEFYTLERSYGFEKYHDWLSVYSRNQPSAKKPPLQYWLTGASLKLGINELLALRIFPYLFFLGILLIGAYLSYLLSDHNPWTGPAYMLLLGSSCVQIIYARSGFLDTGMGFFIMLALLSLYLARNQNWAWWSCGIFVGLGSLQKAPVALMFVAIMLFILARRDTAAYGWKSLKQNRNFKYSCLLAFSMFLSWPLLQTFRMGGEYFKVAIHKEMIKRFVPSDNKIAEGQVFDWIVWLWQDLHLFIIITALCIVLALITKRWRKNSFVFALTVLVLITMIGFTFARGSIYIRYLAVLTPILLCISIKIISDLTHQWKPAVFFIALFFMLLAIPQIKNAIADIDAEDTISPAIKYVKIIDQYRDTDEYVVVDRSLFPPGAYGFFGQSLLRFKMDVFDSKKRIKETYDFLDEVGQDSKLVGLTYLKNKDLMEQVLGPLETIELGEGLMIWKYSRIEK